MQHFLFTIRWRKTLFNMNEAEAVSILKLLPPYLSIDSRHRMSQVCHVVREHLLSPKWEETAMEETLALSAVYIIPDWRLLPKVEPPQTSQFIFDDASVLTCLEKWARALRSWHALGTFLLKRNNVRLTDKGLDLWNVFIYFLLAESNASQGFYLYHRQGSPEVEMSCTKGDVYVFEEVEVSAGSFMQEFWDCLSSALRHIPDRLRARAAMFQLLSDPYWRRRAIDYKDESCPPLAFYMRIWIDAKLGNAIPLTSRFRSDLTQCLHTFRSGLEEWIVQQTESDQDLHSRIFPELRASLKESIKSVPAPLFSVGKELSFHYTVWCQRSARNKSDFSESMKVFYGSRTNQIVWITHSLLASLPLPQTLRVRKPAFESSNGLWSTHILRVYRRLLQRVLTL
eukprot:Gregarina_sp_Pseudo_9__258@NODE_1165_length_1818_cov_30_318156_g1091_i0_p1_GENE_NODE_1165_length_1818_cov_30_318156_g1091_i0NODE_1165_length_1818_cov_30_318156_g1091_i0_p1_ORF_typecomplete_len398_score5_47_NODE_1165_length_1818_cov_30_318156_g1091_i02451438